ncbi:MAG: hypothetical protein E3J70_01545 [Candidatus Heimdallarchaeota archaeon]|nr:MAG: hypothetical protein E3J70_01545 [Candidatus Heimdallarchaeota archaeon]
MKLLVSPQNSSEAMECVNGEADIIDVKNPVEGSLGANFPWVIREIRSIVPDHIPLSATLGDVPYKPGTVALAALGAAHAGATYIKVGLFGTKSVAEATDVMSAVTKTVAEYQLPVSVVAAGYAEGEEIGCINPLLIPEIAHKSSSDFAMIDTFNKKNRKSIFDILTVEDLKQFIEHSKKWKLGTALGGSITLAHIPILKKLKPDIVGIRGAVCDNNDRIKGEIRANLIIEFNKKLKDL